MRKDCVLLKKNDDDDTITTTTNNNNNNNDINIDKLNPQRSYSSRPLIEMTTSGMTHSWSTVPLSSQRFHKGWRYHSLHCILNSFISFFYKIYPMPDLLRCDGHDDDTLIATTTTTTTTPTTTT